MYAPVPVPLRLASDEVVAVGDALGHDVVVIVPAVLAVVSAVIVWHLIGTWQRVKGDLDRER